MNEVYFSLVPIRIKKNWKYYNYFSLVFKSIALGTIMTSVIASVAISAYCLELPVFDAGKPSEQPVNGCTFNIGQNNVTDLGLVRPCV